jgi:hypothetical protein
MENSNLLSEGGPENSKSIVSAGPLTWVLMRGSWLIIGRGRRLLQQHSVGVTL